MITDAELATLCDKSSRDPELVRLYREHDFLTAYSKHTDLRVKADPHTAIGGLWEEYGVLQRDFLIAQGLKPEHRFLDMGCGTGRLARKIVPYLNTGNYLGVDISFYAILHAHLLSDSEGWGIKCPRFRSGVPWDEHFDVVWAFSVFIHLPQEIVTEVIYEISAGQSKGGKFFFSYVPTDERVRTGLKQFKHPYSFFENTAHNLGCSIAQCPDWPGRQKIAVMW